MSSFTHFIHVFLFPPFPTPPTTSKRRHSETQSSAPLRSTCPNHLSLPRLTTLSTLSIPKPFLRSLVLLLSHEHFVIIVSIFNDSLPFSCYNTAVMFCYSNFICTL